MIRTTLMLDDRRLRELKRVAAERCQTLSSIVDEFLADGLRRANTRKRHSPMLPVFDMGESLVNINDRDHLWDAMERD